MDSSFPPQSSTSTIGSSRTFTPMLDQTLSSAYRNKIRSRLQSGKEKSSKSKLSKNLTLENEKVIKDEIKAYQKTKDEWISNIWSILNPSLEKKEIVIPGSDESFQFFVNTTGSTKSRIQKDVEPQSEKFKVENESKEEGDQTNLLFASHPIFFAYQRLDCVFRDRRKQLNNENRVLTCFSTERLSDHIRYGREDNFNRQQDGLFIEGLPKYLKESNINKLEQRLYHESSLKWFQSYVYFIYSFLQSYFFSWSKTFHELAQKDGSPYQFIPNLNKKGFQSLVQAKNGSPFVLMIDIGSINFENHNLYNQENIIASRLIDLYNGYDKMRRNQMISLLSQKIESLKISIANLENSIHQSTDLEDDLMKEKTNRLIDYKVQLLKYIQNRQSHAKEYRNVLLALLSYWEELENRRKKQMFVSTSVVLHYSEIKNEVSESAEAKQLENLTDEEYKLMVDVKNLIYDKDSKEIIKWKSIFDKIKSESYESKSAEEDENILIKSDLKKQIAKITLLLDGREPGEPKFSPISISLDHSLTPFKDCPLHEQRRQLKLSKHKYLIEIYVDNQLMASTHEKVADCNFITKWNQHFNIELKSEPQEIRFDLIEKVSPLNRANLIAQSFVPIPEPIFCSFDDNNDQGVKNWEYVEFNSLEKFQTEDKLTKMTVGKIFYLSFWKIDDENLSIPQTPSSIMNFKIDDLTLEKLKNWKEKSLPLLDPNDPDNIKSIEAIEAYEELLTKNPNVHRSFHLDPSMNEFGFGEISDIANNYRLHLLSKRWQGKHDLKGMSIPLNEKEISLTMFEGKSKMATSSASSKRGVDAKKDKALAILSKVKEKLLKQALEGSEGPKSRSDLIIEQEAEGLNFAFNLFKPTQNRRPLHPVRKERKKITTTLMNNVEVKVMINIMHAFNVPVRLEESNTEDTQNEHTMSTSLRETGNFTYESQVRPFVEVCLQRQTSRTITAVGPQPTWNETLSLFLKVPNDDFSPSNLITITDYININLFDEIIITSENDSFAPRFQKIWLGSLKIPFSTLYLNSKIEGTFKLNKPPVLLGYSYDNRFYDSEQNLSIPSNLTNTYLTLFLIIEPTLALPESVILKCDSIEDEKILTHGKMWKANMKDHFPNRETKAFAIDLNGKFVLITRFLLPLKPPDSLLQNLVNADEVMFRLARFVSLIPSIPDTVAIPGVSDIWCSCNQFLDMISGDEEEHAILLCNFFLYLKKKAGIILGSGIPEGPTCYVIVWDYNGQEPSIWNPVSGEKFNVRDSYLPLNSIGTIFTSDNIYGNIQKYDHPNQINYDLSKTSNWKPLFSKKFSNPGLLSIQPAVIDYEPIDEDYVNKLEDRLEKHLRDSFIRWRRKLPTYFNRTCIQQIKKILPKLEKKIGHIQQSDIVADLQDILITHKMTGFPLNMAYRSIEAVTDTVFATGIHLIEGRKVDFVLAVYLHPYPCNVLSVWVYIGALTKDY